MSTTNNAAGELSQLLDCHRNHGIVDLFSHMSRLPIGTKAAVYRLLSKKGLIVKSPDNDRYPLATVWNLTARALDVRDGEEMSVVL